jgi:integrase
VQIKFTEQTLSTLSVPEGMRDHQWFDTGLPGFGFRKFASGQAAFFVRYRVRQQQRKVTLSKYTPGILAQMRRRAAEILAEARLGNDARAKNIDKCATDAISLGAAVQLYLDARGAEFAPVWLPEVKRYLERYWIGFHGRQLSSIERSELIRELDEIARSRGATTADHAKKSLSALFAWAIDRGYVEANPLSRVKRRSKGGGRERVLSIRELVAVWHGVNEQDEFGRIVRLLILTLQRRSEISDLQEHEVDITAERQITLPATRTKNGKQHVVPLSGPAFQILKSLPRRSDRLFLFGDGQRGFQGWSKAKGRLDISARDILAPILMGRFKEAAGDLTDRSMRKARNAVAPSLGYKSADALLHSIMPHWTLHDLRRTGATLMNEFSLAEPHIIEAVLNHISGGSKGGVAGIYNRASYEVQKRVALDRWGDFVKRAAASFGKGGVEGIECVDAFVRGARQQLTS